MSLSIKIHHMSPPAKIHLNLRGVHLRNYIYFFPNEHVERQDEKLDDALNLIYSKVAMFQSMW